MGRPRLLAIDDDELMAQLVGSIAEEAGFETALASGERGADTYLRFKPDLVVLDILMPSVDGFEILQFLKSCNSHSRVILLSGDEQYRKMAEAVAGDGVIIEDSISKPFDIGTLQARLRLLCQLLSYNKVA